MVHTVVVEAGNGKDKTGKTLRSGEQNFATYRENSFVAVGWLADHDLTNKSKQEIAELVDNHLVSSSDPKEHSRNSVSAKRVLTLITQVKPGDIIVVPGATHRIYGVGIAISSYQYTKDKMSPDGIGLSYRNHYVNVQWVEWSTGKNTPSYLERDAFKQLNCATLWPTLGFTISSSLGTPEYLTKACFWSNVEAAQNGILAGVIPSEAVEVDIIEDAVPVESIFEEPKPYTGDPFTISQDGHYIGKDGFRVPMNFEEFYSENSNYVRRWVQKRIYKNFVDDDVLDWEAELLMHLHSLPERSKARTPGYNNHPNGCHDVIESFNPTLQYGASAPRFFNYINRCLGNRFNTLYSKQSKNPVCIAGNYAMGDMSNDQHEVVDDEYLYSHSSHLGQIAHSATLAQDSKMFLGEFMAFVEKHEPGLIPVINIIANTNTFGEAREELSMDNSNFQRCRSRIKILKDCFLENSVVPKQRKEYRRRDEVLV